MNLFLFANKNKEMEDPTAMEEEDDNSEDWSLPGWPELEKARIRHAKRKRRQARRKRRLDLEAQRKELSAAEHCPLHAVSSNVSIPDDDDDEDDLPEDMKSRGRWNNSCEFLLSIISMSVGMGNFYRFPFVAYANGGGAFLIPYLLVLTFVGRPMYLLELAVGQFCSFGQVKCWEMSPLFRGVGFGSALGSFCVVTYYSSVMGVTLYYLFNSFKAKLPWTVCDPSWATQEVCDKIANETRYNKTISPKMVVNLPQLYFERKVMNEKLSIDDGIGYPQGTQTVCLMVSWILIYLVIVRGVQSTGRAAYFTTFYPYLIIFVMLITACTQNGAYTGMMYFITPDWSRIADPNVWFAAAGQCFFSLSTGFGPIINYASYNPFHHPIYRDAIIVSLMDTLASFIAGLTVFATLGNISYALKKPISEVVDSGPGLVFVSFSDAISNFVYMPQLLSILFFSMLLTLAIGSAVAWQMASISVICDQFPNLSKVLVTTCMCILGFCVALIYVTPGGQFMLTLVDNFGGNVNIYILATLECFGIAWVYGLKNFCQDVEFMLNKKVSCYWRLCWGYIVPFLLTIVMIYSFATAKRLEHNGHAFPNSAIICGWVLTSISLLFFPIGAIYAMYRSTGTIKERFLNALRPTENFGPRKPHDRERWELFRKGIIAHGGPAPDTYKLPDGQTPDNHNLPDWLVVKPDGRVMKRGDAGSESTNIGSEYIELDLSPGVGDIRVHRNNPAGENNNFHKHPY